MLTARCILPNRADDADLEGAEAKETVYAVSNHNRLSRASISFDGVDNDTWCELNFRLEWDAQEENRVAHDFAVVGIDFLTEDGSSIDFTYVPGLTRTQFDPHSSYVAGPDYHNPYGARVQSASISCAFLVPSPARKLAVNIRSWKNSHPFTIRDPKLFQRALHQPADDSGDETGEFRLQTSALIKGLNARRTWKPLVETPLWFKCDFPQGHRLLIRGQLVNEIPGSEGALARIIYLNAEGEVLPPPYPDTAISPVTGAFIDIPVFRQARRFTLDLTPPEGATSVEVGFQTWHAQTSIALVTPLEISLEDDMLLENISGEDPLDAVSFFTRLMKHLEPEQALFGTGPNAKPLQSMLGKGGVARPFTYHDKLKSIQRGEQATIVRGELHLGTFGAWVLPEAPQWVEDPFQSPAWRLEYQSLSWLLSLANQNEAGGLARAVDLALSWSQANPWGYPQDALSAHPLCLSSRTETLLALLSMSAEPQRSFGPQKVLALFAETVRHAYALAQILSQNVFAHSDVHIHVACALLAVARALPAFPLSAYWTSIALTQLKDGFDRLIDKDGVSIEQSLHFQLETISLGLILINQLKGTRDTKEFCEDLTARLKKALRIAVAVTDPSGSLPAFGDAPYGYHHASWLRQLLSAYGTTLLTDTGLATELSYPTGKQFFDLSHAGLVAARQYDQNTNWNYFCASLRSQRSEHGHSDCTSFVYSVGGENWIADPRGSEFHESGATRQYLTSSRAHNIALPDGREHAAGVSWIEAHEILDGGRILRLKTNVHGHEYEHHRIILCLDNLNALAVFDRFLTDPRTTSFEGFLHFDTGINVSLMSTRLAIGYRKNRRIRIIPHAIQGQFSGISIENGRSDRPAALQGFVAQAKGGLYPANVLRYRFSGHGEVFGGVVLAADDRSISVISSMMKSPQAQETLQSFGL